jgi:hypothetical protein
MGAGFCYRHKRIRKLRCSSVNFAASVRQEKQGLAGMLLSRFKKEANAPRDLDGVDSNLRQK